MQLPDEDDRPTTKDLKNRAQLPGVAVIHEVHGSGEVIQGHPTYGYLVEYDGTPSEEWHHINALEIDWAFYEEADEHQLDVEHARERCLIK